MDTHRTDSTEGGDVDTWAKDDAEREALCRDLAGLDAGQWDVQSLCEEWKVRHPAAHLVGATGRTAGGLFVGLPRCALESGRWRP